MTEWSVRDALLWTVGLWLILAVLWGLGFRLHPVVWLAVGTVLVGSALLTGADRADPAFPVRARTPRSPLPRDRRLAHLALLLAGTPGGETWNQRVRPLLATLATDRLRDERGIDHRHDPDAARAALGPELWALVDGTAPAPRTHKALDALIERIHAL